LSNKKEPIFWYILTDKKTKLLKKGSEKMISDSAWEAIKDIFVKKEKSVGRPEKCPRKALEGILYVLKSGCQWSLVPKEYGCYTTIHGKFLRWCRQGKIATVLTKTRRRYQSRNQKNNWFALDTSSKKSPFAEFSGKNPTDRAKRGVKYVMIVDRKGAPLYVDIAPANKHDSQLFSPIMQNFHTSKKVRILAADSAFDVKKFYKKCKEKNIALIASPNPRRRKNIHKFSVPHRWIIEQTFGILSWFRGLKICWAKTLDSALGFLQLACADRLFKMIGIFG
jgi:putative transposase